MDILIIDILNQLFIVDQVETEVLIVNFNYSYDYV